MEHLIRVKGTGNISVKPDLIFITMNLESQHCNYDKTMELAADSVEILQNAIESADFDIEVMSRVFAAIAKTQINPRLDIQFSVKDKSVISEKLLVSAAKNAKYKAEILAKASGVILGDLVSIDYNWSELHLYSQTRYEVEENCMAGQSSYAPDIEPDDIEVSDTVLFAWEIK
jgi:uncharacterized protein YggE